MPYSALPSARRMHYNIDGSVVLYGSATGFIGSSMTVMSQAQMDNLNGEAPNKSTQVGDNQSGSVVDYLAIFFPELIDVTRILTLWSGGNLTFGNLASSVDSTNVSDGTWNSMSVSGTTLSTAAGDSWRSVSPATISTNNSGVKAIRFTVTRAGTSSFLKNIYLWGNKHTGATPDDIIWLESDNTTEWPNDDDWGDLNAGGAAVTHQYYVKNTSATKTANSVVVQSTGSDPTRWTLSLDNISFGSSQSVGNLAPGASQVVYAKFTPPAAASGVYRPYAAQIEADVASWT